MEQPGTQRRRLLTVEDVADWLCMSPKTIRSWVFQGQIDFVRVGRNLRFRPDTVEQMIAAGEHGRRRRRANIRTPTAAD